METKWSREYTSRPTGDETVIVHSIVDSVTKGEGDLYTHQYVRTLQRTIQNSYAGLKILNTKTICSVMNLTTLQVTPIKEELFLKECLPDGIPSVSMAPDGTLHVARWELDIEGMPAVRHMKYIPIVGGYKLIQSNLTQEDVFSAKDKADTEEVTSTGEAHS